MTLLTEVRTVEQEAELLYSKTEIETALDTIATDISQKLSDKNPLLLCVLNGGIITMGELLLRLDFPLELDSIIATRYQNLTSGGKTEWRLEPKISLQGRTVLIIDDILDEGITLKDIISYCQDKGAQATYSAVLVNKLLDKEKPVQADFVALETENRYLFGWGMDYKGYLRNASGIYAVKNL